MNSQNIFQQAETLSEDTRRRLELDNAPIKDIFALLENQGIFVVRIPIAGKGLSGAFYYDKQKETAKMLINSNRTQGHQNFTAAHELCHFILDKDEQPIIIEKEGGQKPAYEKKADSFAANFLMPKEGVNFYIKRALKKKGPKLDDFDIVRIREEFGASWQTTIYRLHDLGFVFDKPHQKKLTETPKLNSLAMQFGFEPQKLTTKGKLELPAEFYRLAFTTYFRKKISLNRLAEILRQPYDETKDQVFAIKKMLKNEKLKE